jgi:glyoxylase-like metal-dependent hydrolase (beta-lactamase superfamily II)
MAETPPPPKVDPSALSEIAKGVFVIGDRRVPLVPNIGIVLGDGAALVIDTGMGPANGAKVLEVAKHLAGPRALILTLTHFHPEHGFGAQAFKGVAKIIYNEAQRDELKRKGEGFLGMFRTFGPAVAAALEGTKIVEPDEVYEGPSATIDLGGRSIELRASRKAHTLGDQTVHVPDCGIVFMGDLVEERMFPIFPWFPPDEVDIDAANWARVLSAINAEAPRIVVPGHGAQDGGEILRTVRDYMIDLGRRVKSRRDRGEDGDVIVAALGPTVRSEHADWSQPEWVDFAIRYFAATGAAPT